MFVETHAFKEAFVHAKASGFVVCTEPPHAPRRLFAEIFGAADRYHIFETRAAAEFQMSLAATGQPPRDDLTVNEVRVDNIRDYQTLTGFKTVFLVDREGQMTQSLRVGDMPLTARSQTPFAPPQREGLRVVHSTPALKPLTSPPLSNEPPAPPARRLTSTRPPTHRSNSDPFSHVPIDPGEDPSRVVRTTPSVRHRTIRQFFRDLFAW